MRSKIRTWLLAIVCVAITGYVAICGLLFVEQRQILYRPSRIPLGDPPAGSGFTPLEVEVPGLGRLKDWQAPPTSPGMPTIVFFHGNASDLTDFLDQGARFHERGWGVVLSSYPGYSGNPGSPTEAGLMADARATIAAAHSSGPIIVWGHSLGSGVAARMASEGRAAGLVLEAPYTSVTDLAAAQYPYVPVRWLLLDRFDTRAGLGRIRVPVLILHSTDDPTIPFAMGQELADRLGNRATFVKMTGMGHTPHQTDLSATVVAWAKTRHILE